MTKSRDTVHVFSLEGQHLAYDGASGALHSLDEVGKAAVGWAMDNLDSVAVQDSHPPKALVEALSDRFDSEAVTEAWEEIRAAYGTTLFAPDHTLKTCAGEDESSKAVEAGLKSMCIDIAHDCNLACRYCFASTGTFGGAPCLMSVETGKAAIDFLMTASHNRRYLDVDFFGGEPLLAFNVVRELVGYARKEGAKRGKEFRFTLTTNCTLLDDAKARFLADNGISLILSLDGRPEVHDRMRPFRGGAPSHALTLENALRAVQARGGQNYYIRGTYTAHNLDFDEDVKYLYSKGFRKMSLEPAVGEGAGAWEITREHMEEIGKSYGRLVKFWLDAARRGDPFEFYHFNLGLEGGLCRERRVTGCGAGYEYVAVTPEGEVYPCHQLVGNSDYLLGNVFDGIRRLDLSHEFSRSRVPHKPQCVSCWARYLCGGGCHARAIAATGDLLKPDPLSCDLMKKRLEYALLAQYSLAHGRKK